MRASELAEPPDLGLGLVERARRCRAPAAGGSVRRRRACGAIAAQSSSSAGASRTSWPGSRTQAPSSATCPARAIACSSAAKAGAGSRGSSPPRRRSMPMPDEVRVLGVEGVERGEERALQPLRRRRATSPTAPPRASMRTRPAVSSARRAAREAAVAGEGVRVEVEGRAVEERGERGGGVGDGVRLELGEALGRAAAARGRRAGRGRRRRRGCGGRWCRGSRSGRRRRRRSAGRGRAGRSRRSPGAIGRSPRRTTRAVTSAVPWCRWTGSHWVTGRVSLGQHAEFGVDAVGRRVQRWGEHHVAAARARPG